MVKAGSRACNVEEKENDEACHTKGKECDPGTYSPGGAAKCTTCPDGRFAVAAGATSCDVCPELHSCSESAKTPCAKHQYSPKGMSKCLNCQAGQYRPSQNDVVCSTCPAGFACAGTGKDAEECVPGKYSPGGLGACRSCPSGYYAEEKNSHRCKLCPAGYFCTDSSKGPERCPRGNFSAAGANTGCSPCPNGARCDAEGLRVGAASPGFLSTALGTNHICPLGTYRPPNTLWESLPSTKDRHRCKRPRSVLGLGGNWPEYEGISDKLITRIACQKAAIAAGAVIYSYSEKTDSGGRNCMINVRPIEDGSTTGAPSSECEIEEIDENTDSSSNWNIYAADAAWRSADTQFADWAPLLSCVSSTDDQVSIRILTEGTCTRLGLARVASLEACKKLKERIKGIAGDVQDDAITVLPHLNNGQEKPFGCYIEYDSWHSLDGKAELKYNSKFSDELLPCKKSVGCESSPEVFATATYTRKQVCLQSCKLCAPCPVGHSCLDRDAHAVLCPAGTYSPEGDANCHPCPAGKKCGPIPELYSVDANKVKRNAFTNGEPVPCGDRKYSPLGNSACLPCPAGHICASKEIARPCPPGFYADEDNLSACLPCPPGFACPDFNHTEFLACDPGYYSLGGTRACTECPAGFSCAKATELPVPCPVTSFSQRGQTECSPCPSGHSCDPTNSTACKPGHISAEGDSTCVLCPAGNYCPDDNTIVPCPPGNFSHGGDSECRECQEGYSCPAADGFSNMLCSPGTWSTAGQTACTPCPPGTYCGVGKQSAPPVNCPKGQYAEFSGSAHCVICPPGFSCELESKTRCALGWYSAAGNASCTACPAGLACDRADVVERCTAGQFSPVANSVCTECNKGQYSAVPAQAQCSDCAKGTYAPNAGATECLDCPAGFRCDGSSQPVQCPAGKYSEEKAAVCKVCNDGFACQPQSKSSSPQYSECPIGYFCNTNFTLESPVRGVAMIPCPAGKYGTRLGALSEADGCAPCPAGYFCKSGSLERDKVLCPSGYFCEEGTAEPVACEEGTHNYLSPGAMGYKSASNCTQLSAKCPGGSYCKVGQSPRSCPRGAYCPEGSPGPLLCPAGKFSTDGLEKREECHNCTMGSFCPKGSTWPVPCPAGTYGDAINLEKASHCIGCEAGWACQSPGTVFTTREPCQPGHYCPLKSDSARKQACVEGKYAPKSRNENFEVCVNCPKYKYCAGATGGAQKRPIDCEEGHFCRSGTSETNHKTQLCSPGTFSNNTHIRSREECTKCPSGFACNKAGLTKPSGPCSKGHYCPEGTKLATDNPCPAGTWSPRTNLTSEVECELCPTGYECSEAGIGDLEGYQCEPGFYMNLTGAKACLPCQAGYYCPNQGMVVPVPCGLGSYSANKRKAACLKCSIDANGLKLSSAYFCDSNTTSEKQMLSQICPAGMFCPVGTEFKPSKRHSPCQTGHYCVNGTFAADQQECPPGSYNPNPGGESLDVCLECPAGSYCKAAASKITGLCAAGYYCPVKSTHNKVVKCPRGKYRDELGGRDEADCGVCPTGFYCETKRTVNPLPCPEGSFCGDNPDKKSAPRHPKPCPPGKYGPQPRLRESRKCLDCPAGWFCSGGKANPDGPCSAGYFCTSGAQAAQPSNVVDTWFGICPPGHYCGVGTRVPHACPPGKFNTLHGQGSIDACEVCEKGQYCENAGNVAPDDDCAPGHVCANYSFADHQFKKITPPGTYAPKGSWESTACAAGTYAPIAGLPECLECPAGYICDPQVNETTTTTTTTTTRIDTFKFALVESGFCTHDRGLAEVYNYQMCAAEEGSGWENHGVKAWFNIKLKDNREDIKDNHQIHEAEKREKFLDSNPRGCYFDTSQNRAEMTLENGTNLTGALRFDSSRLNRRECSPEIPCLCKSIPPVIPRVYEIGAIRPEPCPAGYFCPAGSHSGSVEDCPAGTYGGEGLTRVRDCTPCEAGHYCPNATSVSDMDAQTCSGGFFCHPGSTTHEGAQEYCEMPVSRSLKCPVGHYCPDSTAVPIPCPRGKYSGDEGEDLQSTCKWCPPGQYCGKKGLEKSQDVCDPGFYCLKGVDNRRPTSGISKEDSGDLVGGDLCPRGFYCPVNKVEPVPCQEGKYSNTTGAKVSLYLSYVLQVVRPVFI